MGGGDDDDHESNSNSSLNIDHDHPVKIIREYNFFDENRPCIKEHRIPLLQNDHERCVQEITLLTPKASTDHDQYPNYDHRKRESINRDDDDDSVSPGAATIRLFGVDLLISSSDDRKGKQKMEVETAGPSISSSKRKQKILSDDDSLEVEVIGGTIIRLIGANLSISSDDDDQKGKQKMEVERKRKRKRSRNNKYPPALPPIPPLFHPTILEEIEEHQEPTFLFEKKLEVADVRRDQNRLFIPRSDELMGFLSQDETTMVEERNKNLIVPTRDNVGNQYTMHLTRWHSVFIIVLNRDWFKYVNTNGLNDGDSVQGWGYRCRNNVFRLALNFIRKPPLED